VENNSKSNPNFIPHSRPTLGAEEIKAASDVVASGHIAEGSVVKEFEDAFAQKLGVNFAVATGSGTAALHLTLLAMGIGPSDEVIMPSYVCTALLNAVRYVGASPVFAEINPPTFNIDPDDVEKRLTSRTKAIIVPHLFGLAADLNNLLALNVPIIEDGAQSMGGAIDNTPLGTSGNAGIFSFYATKVMTCGEGGMVVSDSEKFAERVKDLKTYDEKDHYETRFNYKLTDSQAAIGLVQLGRLDAFIQRRRAIAQHYREAFSFPGVNLPPHDPGHIYYRFVIGLESDCRTLIRDLRKRGIGCAQPIHTPLHHCLNVAGYPITGKAWETSLSIPIYPSLSDEDVHRVIEVVTDTLVCHAGPGSSPG
jgi:dTDP-4-amino-4,6-dideoxygalactose transaminase